MTVLYRALWSEPLEGDAATRLEELRRIVAEWVRPQRPSDEPFPLGEFHYPGFRNGRDRRGEHFDVPGRGFRFRTADQGELPTDVWRVDVRVLVDDADGGERPAGDAPASGGRSIHCLVENSLESDEPTSAVSIARPNVVGGLLKVMARAHLGTTTIMPLAVKAADMGVGNLVEHIRNPKRKLPVIVCTEPPEDNLGWEKYVEDIARRVQGIALVVMLSDEEVREFRQEMKELSTWGGAIRIYSPGIVRNPYYPYRRIRQAPKFTGDSIVSYAAALSARRRIPEFFGLLSDAAMRNSETPELDNLREDLAVAEAGWQQAEEAWEGLDSELADLRDDLARCKSDLARLQGVLDANGLIGEFYHGGFGAASEEGGLEEVDSFSAGIVCAQSGFSTYLVIDDSCYDDENIHRIDGSPNSGAWGAKLWNALKSLYEYAHDVAEGRWNSGGYWEWCLNSGSPFVFGSPKKYVAMKESETVSNNARFRAARTFPVDREVDESGEKYMESHLKIAAGGGPLIPRVYFYDDTRGPTGKIHIGGIGPHDQFPNTKSN